MSGTGGTTARGEWDWERLSALARRSTPTPPPPAAPAGLAERALAGLAGRRRREGDRLLLAAAFAATLLAVVVEVWGRPATLDWSPQSIDQLVWLEPTP